MSKKLHKYVHKHIKKGHAPEKIESHIINQGVHEDVARKAVKHVLDKIEKKKYTKQILILASVILIATIVLFFVYLNAPAPEVKEKTVHTCALPEGITCTGDSDESRLQLHVRNNFEYDIEQVEVIVKEKCDPHNVTILAKGKRTFTCPINVSSLDILFKNLKEETEHEFSGSII